MLREFDEMEGRVGTEKVADIRRALHYLLGRQFVFSGDRGAARVYDVIMDGRFRRLIDDFFDSCGYRVHRDPDAQWAGITAMGEDVPLPKLRLDETIVTLVVAAHWQDEVNVGAIEDRGVVVSTLNTLFDRYKEMTQSNSITISRFREILKAASQRNLVELGDFDSDAHDLEVYIRPMIKLITGSDALQRLERYASSFGDVTEADGGEIQ